MQRRRFISLAFFIVSLLLLLPNFYRNRWSAVDADYYANWQNRYDRLIVARLVKTRQNGFFSAGGLLGLGDASAIVYESRTTRHQFNTYFHNGEFKSYYVYKSNPGVQAIAYGVFDEAFSFSGEQKLKILRAGTALLTAMVFGLMISFLAAEFGLLAGLLTLVFSIVAMWIVLPGGSIFWDSWAFYAPFLAGTYVLANAPMDREYRARKIHTILYLTMLIKVLFSGFDLTTTVLVMATVPFTYYAIHQHWDRKTFLVRMVKVGLVLLAATVTGLIVLAIQIIASAGSVAYAYTYLLNRFTSHTGGDYEYFDQALPVRKIGVMEVLPKYLLMPAIDLPQFGIHILYWQLIVVFAGFTLIFMLKHKLQRDHLQMPPKSIALLASTWYSILAPLSWYILFRPHSFIHTHVNTMGWQMPFTLLGFALCGFVITDLFAGRVLVTSLPSPASQTD
jgi:hypothetical protein